MPVVSIGPPEESLHAAPGKHAAQHKYTRDEREQIVQQGADELVPETEEQRAAEMKAGV